MVFGLSTESKVALAVMGGIFIGFALLSSFYFPTRNPNFPGAKWRNAYVVLCIAFFLGMMATVLVFGKEEEEAEAGEHPAQTTPGETTPGETTPGETTPGETTPGGGIPAEYANGDPAAGKTIFVSKCGICHVLSDAGTNGTIGPNLDEKKPDEALIVDRVLNGKGAMPAFKGQLSDKEIADVVAYVNQAVNGS
jgi:mono/diheme cytochrome c family protein